MFFFFHRLKIQNKEIRYFYGVLAEKNNMKSFQNFQQELCSEAEHLIAI